MELQDIARTGGIAGVTAIVDVGSTNPQGVLEIWDSGESTLLVSFDLENPAFVAGAAGIQVIDGLPKSSTPGNNGVAARCLIKNRDEAIVFRGSVGLSATDIIINDVNIVTTVDVDLVTVSSVTQPAGAVA